MTSKVQESESTSSLSIAAPRGPNEVDNYYTRQHAMGEDAVTIYGIWEQGRAYNDSVTPSTYVPEYRSHIVLKLLSLTSEGSTIFSLGCGNGFVEGSLAALSRTVRAIDCNAEAVELSRKKGVDAFVANYYDLEPNDLAGTDAVYADGFLGHVFHRTEGMRPALSRLRHLVSKPGTYLILSNDAPNQAQAPYAEHERLSDFWLLSKGYLEECVRAEGFEPVESYYFPYIRPLSGLRNRTICVALVR